MHRILLAMVLLGPMAAVAETSFWVSVGSYQDAAVAERVKAEAERALNAAFTVQRAETSSGTYQRVATGPFASHEAALTAQDQAKASGYPDSWIFAIQTDEETSPSGANLDAIDDDLTDQAPQSTLEEVLRTVNEVPTEIPPGYQLNQLFRDGVVPTPETKH